MVTVLRAEGLRIVIYANDHLPGQVHVFRDAEAEINLLGSKGLPDLAWAET